jgi:hypothetical protein
MPIIITSSGNCNFAYLTGLRHSDTPELAMREALTNPTDNGYGVFAPKKADPEPMYRTPSHGMYLFAQGSDDPVAERPYAPSFKTYIEEQGLGTVHEMPPVPNRMHGNQPGILFIWIINHEACAKWWMEKVGNPWKERRAASTAALAELKAKAKKELK